MQRVFGKMFRIPVFRYVEDYFSAGRWGVRLDMTLEIVAAALGLPTDPRKTAGLTAAMTVLGMKVTLCWERRCPDLMRSCDEPVSRLDAFL